MEKIDKHFTYHNDEWTCPECGSHEVTVRAGMMVDRAVCMNCGFEEYI